MGFKHFFKPVAKIKPNEPTKREKLVKIAHVLRETDNATTQDLKLWLGSLSKWDDETISGVFDFLKERIDQYQKQKK